VIAGTVFTIKRTDVKIGIARIPIQRTEIYDALKVCAPNTDFGFDEKTLPNREWLLNILFTIKPDHAIFRPPKPEFTRLIPHG
jgi:hypothetical protein